jgi:predicted cobalt transporter CbtA
MSHVTKSGLSVSYLWSKAGFATRYLISPSLLLPPPLPPTFSSSLFTAFTSKGNTSTVTSYSIVAILMSKSSLRDMSLSLMGTSIILALVSVMQEPRV